MSSTTQHTTLLRRALLANAVFSGICGSLCALASSAVAGLVGIAPAEIFALGVNLEVFAILLVVLATRRDPARGWVRALVMAVIAMDVLWVAGSAALLLSPAATPDHRRPVDRLRRRLGGGRPRLLPAQGIPGPAPDGRPPGVTRPPH